MLSSELLLAELPYLRRFTRALYGSKATADQAVMFTLDFINLKPSIAVYDVSPRVCLFRAFFRTVRYVNSFFDAELHQWEFSASGIAGRANIVSAAYLLTFLEEMSIDQTTTVLEIDEAQLERLLDTAVARRSRQRNAKVFIIEEDARVAQKIKDVVEQQNHQTVAVARTSGQAIGRFTTLTLLDETPDLIIANSVLGQVACGGDIVHEIFSCRRVPAIFIAHDLKRDEIISDREETFVVPNPLSSVALSAVIGHALEGRRIAA